MYARIDVYSHYFKVTDFRAELIPLIQEFTRDFSEVERVVDRWGQVTTTIARTYAVNTENRQEYRFHINVMDVFYHHLESNGYRLRKEDAIVHPVWEAAPAKFKIKAGWEKREGQVLATKYILETRPKTAMIPLQAGAGKTATTFFAMAEAGVRTLLYIKASLMQQWIDAYRKQISPEQGDIHVIQGNQELLSAIWLGMENKITAKFIVMSNVTMQNYITEWERSNGTSEKTPVPPEEINKLLKIGMVVQDEWHLFFHLNFKIDLYTNAEYVIKLSATVDPDSAFLKRIYAIASPVDTRFEGIPYNKYVHVVGFGYNINDAEKLRISARGRTSYSHNEFEKSIFKSKEKGERYLKMISGLVKDFYINRKQDGMKLIVYAGLRETCTTIAHRLQEEHPYLEVNRVVSGDSKKLLDTSDIIVSTLGSIGVGTDVVDLYCVLLTVAIASRSANEQSKGRLREMKNYEGVKPLFLYLFSMDIRKHVEYHYKKLEDFKGKCLTHATLRLEERI